MTASLIISGFILGMAGSLHCMGMCGPLSLVLPLQGLSSRSKLLSLLTYQFGRITTYALLGLAFGFFGRQLFHAGFQQTASLVIGSIIVLAGVLLVLGKYQRSDKWGMALVRKAFDQLWIRAWNTQSFFLIGMVNGLLPCGMIFVALLAILSFPYAWDAPLFMIGFGFGTLPAMMIAAYAMAQLRPTGRRLMRQVVPYFMMLIGVWIFLRGLNLGIPFVSPEIPVHTGEALHCAN